MTTRLNLGNDIHYVLNDKASTPSEVLGIDYNSALKPILESMADDVNKSSMNKLEQFIALQQHASELASKIDAKRNHITTLQSYIEQVTLFYNNFLKNCLLALLQLIICLHPTHVHVVP